MAAMQVIQADFLGKVSYLMLQHASKVLPPGVEEAIRRAAAEEPNSKGKAYLEAMVRNMEVSRARGVPLCQDTGVPMFYLDLPPALAVEGDVRAELEEATRKATRDAPLRQQVTHPLTNVNSGDNVGWGAPPIFVNYNNRIDYLELLAVPRGGGAEIKSSAVVPIPGAPKESTILKTVLDAVAMAGGENCSPNIVGVAVGGFGIDFTEYLARRAIYREPLNSRHEDPQVAALEEKLFRAVNNLGIGPLGVGGKTTCLGLHMEIAGCHSAVFPIAVSFYCWSARFSRARIYPDGRVQFVTHPELNKEFPHGT
ncbi:MAG: fumarate hydratase [Syntrophaceae bacterium]|nr:fumarate hydratase [Syntrophaceae bacterium]